MKSRKSTALVLPMHSNFLHYFFLYFRALCKPKEDIPEKEFVKLANTESSLNASLESLDHDDDAASEVKR